MDDDLRATRELILDLQKQVKSLSERFLTPEPGNSNLTEKLQSKESKDEDATLRNKVSIGNTDVAVGNEIPDVQTDHINANGILAVDLHKSSYKGVSDVDLHKSRNLVWEGDLHKSYNGLSDIELHKPVKPVRDMDGSSGADLNPLMDFTQHFTTDEVFESRSELENWCKEVGIKMNTVVIKLNSQSETPRRRGRLLLGCERSGAYRKHKKKAADEEGSKKRRRKSGTKKCNCPFMLKGIPLDGDRWKLKVISGIHNHPLENLNGHAYAARLTEEEKMILVDMSLSGVKPKEILATLKNWNENNKSTPRTIYNARNKIRVVDTEGKVILQQLIKHLTKKHYVHWYEKDNLTDDLQLIFWAHPESIMFAKSFPRVLMIDCTYKAKRSKMPLLHFSGVTSTGRSFCAALAFISSEREENYVWALRKLKSIFDPSQLPQVFITYRDSALMKALNDVFSKPKMLLCTSHINRNVEAHVKKNFGSAELWDQFIKDWTAVTQAMTEIEFNDRWRQFKITWAAFPEDIYYLELVWLQYKENFVWAWTNNIKHLGNYTTNRAEGAHGKLRKHLDSLQTGIETVWGAMYNMFTIMFNELKTEFEKSSGQVKHSHNIPAFRDLRTHVSQYAIDMIVQEITRAEEIGFEVSSCRHVLRTAYGLPCAHELMEYKAESRPIPLNAVDAHWKQLTGVPNMVTHDELEYEPEMQLLKKRWAESTYDEKRAMLYKFKEFCTPTVTNLSEPKTVKTRGRPKGSTSKKTFQEHQKSTKRDLSAEQLNSDMVSSPMQKKGKLATQSQSSQPNSSFPPSEGMLRYITALPRVLEPIIEDIQDVPSDGNCGYRAIALSKGWNDDMAWMRVRTDLIREMDAHSLVYSWMFGDQFCEQFRRTLNCFDSPCSKDYWMVMPEMGYMIASAYNIVLVFISQDQCLTFFPLRDAPRPGEHHIISIGLVHRLHFVRLVMKADFPIPPIASSWYSFSTAEAKEWLSLYDQRIKRFQEIIPSTNTTIDFIDSFGESMPPMI